MHGFLGPVRGATLTHLRSFTTVAAAGAAALIAFAAVGSLGAPSPDRAGIVYDPALTALPAQPPAHAARPPLVMAGVGTDGAVVTDCRSFLAATRSAARRAAWNDDPALRAYLDCVPEQLLAEDHRPRTYLAPADRLGVALAERLDLASLQGGLIGAGLPADLAATFGHAPHPAALAAARLSVEPRGVTAVVGDQVWHFDAVASVDADGTGVEALLLRLSREAGPGEAPATLAYAVLRQDDTGLLHAVPAERALLPGGGLPWWAALEPAR